jgi:SAM-dependent methyltransferase
MNEEEIRPQKIFDEYLRLCANDTDRYFASAPRYEINCPACERKGEPAFEKNGFKYALCPDCQTLYVSPRPDASAFTLYYTEAPSVRYWATTFYQATAEARREKLWKHKARQLHEILGEPSLGSANIVDIGGGYGVFAEEMEKLSGVPVTIIEPGPDLAAVCRERNLKVVEKFLEDVNQSDLPNGKKLFTSFELFEHLHEPELFCKHLYSLMAPGDLFVFTTLSGTGLDIQVLWSNSKSVNPPHHLNFFNPISVNAFLQRVGFIDVRVTTPGKLDLDIMQNCVDQVEDRFWRTLLHRVNDQEKSQWQNMVASNGWSSHMMVQCMKPDTI